MGRHAKPAALKLLDGNREKVSKAAFDRQTLGVPQPKGRCEAPAHLPEDVQRLWADVVASLPVELLTRADTAILERFTTAWATYRRAWVEIELAGMVIDLRLGRGINPYFTVANKAAEEMHKAGSEIGLSPAARARLTVEGMPDDDPMAQLMGGALDGAWRQPRKTTNE